MSSIVLKSAVLCVGLLWFGPGRAEDALRKLSCRTETAEDAAFRQAPRHARRVKTHVLEVVSKKGTHRFGDRAPHDEGGISGLHWRYCGFNPHAKAHLVGKTDAGLFTGNLLLDESGRLLQAGHTVLFSPDGLQFLAIGQESGVDGETWAVYDIRGKALWSGYAGTLSKADGTDIVVSTFERPQWNGKGQLAARFVCASSETTGVLTLTRTQFGKWSWRGPVKCRSPSR